MSPLTVTNPRQNPTAPGYAGTGPHPHAHTHINPYGYPDTDPHANNHLDAHGHADQHAYNNRHPHSYTHADGDPLPALLAPHPESLVAQQITVDSNVAPLRGERKGREKGKERFVGRRSRRPTKHHLFRAESHCAPDHGYMQSYRKPIAGDKET
jgi:hypothetical protein